MKKTSKKSKGSDSHCFQWYIITTVSGKEDSIIDDLWAKIISYKYDDHVQDIKVIKEKVTEVKTFDIDSAPSRMNDTLKIKWETIKDAQGKVIEYRRTKTELKNRFSGYVFMKMDINDELWFIIRNTQGVTGLVGSSGKNTKPIPISDYELEKMINPEKALQQEQETNQQEKNTKSPANTPINNNDNVIECPYQIGDSVRILAAGMENQIAQISNINLAKQKIIIKIDLFGQQQEISYDYDQVEKV